MLKQFGPCLKWPWTKLEAPELTEQLIDRMVEGTQAQAAGRSIRELERMRDDYLVAIQQVLRQFNIGAGATLRALETRLYEQNAAATRALLQAPQARADARPLPLMQVEVRSEWVDYNGHMTDFRYAQVFGDATDALLRAVGVDDAYRASQRAMYTVESHVTHHAEAKLAEPLVVETRILGLDDKRLHLFHRLMRRGDEGLVASGEQLFLHVNSAAGKASAMDGLVRQKLERIRDQQADQALPAQAGRRISMSRS